MWRHQIIEVLISIESLVSHSSENSLYTLLDYDTIPMFSVTYFEPAHLALIFGETTTKNLSNAKLVPHLVKAIAL